MPWEYVNLPRKYPPWTWMVGRRNFLLGPGLFPGAMLVLGRVASFLFFPRHLCSSKQPNHGDGFGRLPNLDQQSGASWTPDVSSELMGLFVENMKLQLLPWKLANFPYKSMVGRCISYWNGPFLGDMLVFDMLYEWSYTVCNTVCIDYGGHLNAQIIHMWYKKETVETL